MNYPYYYNRQLIPQMEQAQLKGRPVSSIDEVKAATVDFDGSVFYFPDLANKHIYTKQINADGTSSVNMYELKPIPTPQAVNPSQYVTREEFEAALKTLQEKLLASAMTAAGTQVKNPTDQVPQAPQTSSPQAFNF